MSTPDCQTKEGYGIVAMLDVLGARDMNINEAKRLLDNFRKLAPPRPSRISCLTPSPLA